MKVEINNMMGVRDSAIALSPGTIQAVLGTNMSGKTSFAYALAAVLCRNNNPLKLPATATGAYLRDDTETGSVVLSEDDEDLVRWEVKSGEMVVAAAAKKAETTAAAAGLVEFATLGGESRTAMWEDLFLPPAAVLLKRVRKELEGAGLDKDEITGVMDTIKERGWESVDKVYKDRGRRAKNAWKAITGRNYGIKVAADWHPEGWLAAYDGLTVEQCEERLRSGHDALTGLHVARAITQAEIDGARAARDELKALQEPLAKKVRSTQAAKAEYEATQTKAEELREKGSQLKSELVQHRKLKPSLDGDPLKCPCCEAELLMTGDGALEARDRDAEERAMVEWRETEDKLRKETENQLALYHAAQKPAVEAEERLRDAREAEAQVHHNIGTLTDKAQLADTEATDDRTDEIDAKNREIENLRKQRDLVEKRLGAKAHHESVQAYDQIVTILGPKGVRAKAMEGAMANLDQFLVFIAKQTGWPRVKLDRNYNISIGKRASLRMCSESERWRGQATLQVAVGRLKRDPVIVLDRADILDPKGREDLAALTSLVIGREDPPCIVVCSTSGPKQPGLSWLTQALKDGPIHETWLEEKP